MKTLSFSKSIILLSAFALSLLSSCQKEEIPVPVHSSGASIVSTIDMNDDYKWQVFFDLKTNSVVKKNLKTAWDIAFEASQEGYHIILNASKFMFAANTNGSNFDAVTDTIGFGKQKKFDSPSGSFDSTAIGDWRGGNKVYIIDRGYNEAGGHLGFRKIQFQSVDAGKYIVRFAELNGNNNTVIEIKKDDAYNFTFLSFASKSVVNVEPPKKDWDLVFTQYIEALSTPYLVTGVLLNRYNTLGAKDQNNAFSQIAYSDISNYTFTSNLAAIGYSWKKYDYDTSTYIIYPQITYLIQDNEGVYYKLHFIDFYDDKSGKKGNPKWEQQQL